MTGNAMMLYSIMMAVSGCMHRSSAVAITSLRVTNTCPLLVHESSLRVLCAGCKRE